MQRFDQKMHAFGLTTGAKLWEAKLPAFAMATPMTYAAGGKQYVVIAAGGHAALAAGAIRSSLSRCPEEAEASALASATLQPHL